MTKKPVTKAVPLTRPITFLVHEPVFPLMRRLADDKASGSIGKVLRLLVYVELVKQGYLDPGFLDLLYTGDGDVK